MFLIKNKDHLYKEVDVDFPLYCIFSSFQSEIQEQTKIIEEKMLIVFPSLIVTGLNLKLIQHFREHHFSFREGRQPNSRLHSLLGKKNQCMLLHEKKNCILLVLYLFQLKLFFVLMLELPQYILYFKQPFSTIRCFTCTSKDGFGVFEVVEGVRQVQNRKKLTVSIFNSKSKNPGYFFKFKSNGLSNKISIFKYLLSNIKQEKKILPAIGT
ncbi:hypothetical protein P5673_019591 [Acropora cervicornis]|uniref:Uncharacterized protein n=1 Tax=Acropora cervicornis TaxID=6130 RepID=A0AAD9QB34_ACRCE|nr:hypothetical protein P5673_019591 [Acropora cervicornis]